jgi:hypothetical protein
MIENDEIAAMANGLVQAYGMPRAIETATDHALAALDQGHLGVAKTWRRILNSLNQASASPQVIMVRPDPR